MDVSASRLAFFIYMIIKQIVTIVAVEDRNPQVFVKEIRPYIKPLIDRKKLYLEVIKKSA